MKRAIIVKGNPGVGKSPIIRDVYHFIKLSYSPTIVYEDVWTHDLFGILQIGNLKVGIFSEGDTGSRVKHFITECLKYECDIILGCCRNRGSTFNEVRANLKYPHFVIDYVIPEWISTSLNTRITIGIEEVKTRLIGLPKL